MDRVGRFFIRIFSFLRKEIVSIIRQPRLVLTLVLGPFLILLLFGVGFSNQGRTLRTLFVVPEDSELEEYIEEYATSLGPQLQYEGSINSLPFARRQLRMDEADAVIVVPSQPYETVRNSEQAVFLILHNEIDPIQSDYVRVFGEIYVGEVNRRIWRAIAEEGQVEAASLQTDLGEARQDAADLRRAIERNDPVAVHQNLENLREDLTLIELAVGLSAPLILGTQEVTGREEVDDPFQLLADIRAAMEAVERGEDPQESLERVRQMEQDLATLEQLLEEFRSITPLVLVSPFSSQAESIAHVQLNPSDYYAASVIILLLQHLCVTFAGLSIVRERRTGAMELFHVAPLSAIEILLGKYVSFFLFTAVLAAVLTALLVLGLNIPMLGSWADYALVLAVFVLASLGIGFVMSLLAETTTQVVQYAMIFLLVSVFFTGFFLGLDSFRASVRAISWALPATYGIRLLRDIMLRGQAAQLYPLYVLGGMSLASFLGAWLLLRRQLAQS
jgi:ABC-2 type transport system permease protein